jgi:hypothetical protein
MKATIPKKTVLGSSLGEDVGFMDDDDDYDDNNYNNNKKKKKNANNPWTSSPKSRH